MAKSPKKPDELKREATLDLFGIVAEFVAIEDAWRERGLSDISLGLIADRMSAALAKARGEAAPRG